MDERAAIAHLYRRAGFGGTPDEIDAGTRAGYEATVDRLLTGIGSVDPGAAAVVTPQLTPPADLALKAAGAAGDRAAIVRTIKTEAVELIGWWLGRMVAAGNPLTEKLPLFWHGHFATAITKVRSAALMQRQYQTLQTRGAGDFTDLAIAVAQDPAMMIWLDANSNQKGDPNENFGREFLELFSLGHGHYTETDVREAARAFTGWTYARRLDRFVARPQLHDDDSKTVLGQTGDFDGVDVVRLVTATTASHRWIASRVFSHFAYPVAPDDAVVAPLAKSFGEDRDVQKLLRGVFLSDGFRSTTATTGLVKQPVEWVVGSLHQLGVTRLDAELLGTVAVKGKQKAPANAGTADATVLTGLRDLGQLPFDPPSVGGWPPNNYWLSTATAYARLNLASTIVGAADLRWLERTKARGRVSAIGDHLGVTWSKPTARALGPVAKDPAALAALALVTPEYTLA